MRPRFSILIPTRNRCSTLGATIQTCLDQDYPDMEVVVCDNASDDGTDVMVSGLDDRRLRYVRFPDLVAMSMNWERGLKLVHGSHLILIGSDDALIPSSLKALAILLERTESRAINWQRPNYNWPDIRLKGVENFLHVPALQLGRKVNPVDPLPRLQSVLTALNGAVMLPCLYNSVVEVRLIEEIASASAGGIYFQCQIPDIYSGVVNCLFLERYFHCQIPFSINGGSSGSNGVATFGTRGGNPIEREFRTLNAQSNLDFDESIPDIYCEATVIGESFLRAQRNFPEKTAVLKLRMTEIYAQVRSWIERFYAAGEAHKAMIALENAEERYRSSTARSDAGRDSDGARTTLQATPVAARSFPTPVRLARRLAGKVLRWFVQRVEFGGFSGHLGFEYTNISQVSAVLSRAYYAFYRDIYRETRNYRGLPDLLSFRRKTGHVRSIVQRYFGSHSVS